MNNRNTGDVGKGSSGFKWVYYEKHLGKYRARFRYDNARIDVGFYESPEEAYTAVVEARQALLSERGEVA